MQTYDDRLTFLLPRPIWVNDIDVTYCSSCNNAFGPLRRRHHCRNCGNIFCHECSSRKVPLPQLGYGTKPARVCNGCFDVAYLVTYAIDEDHGVSTQMHGVRGLLDLTEKDDEKDLHNMVAYGGVDALIWLCRSSRSIKLHHLTTTILAMLAEKESIRPVIITKWALPPLLFLIRFYTSAGSASPKHQKSPANSIHSNKTPSLSSNPSSDISNASESRQSITLEIIINCTHILYQLSRAGIFSLKEVISDSVFDTLLMLAAFDIDHLQPEKGVVEGTPIPVNIEDEQQVLDRVNIIQSLASKAISAISSLVSFQASIIELIQASNKLPILLRSSNTEVRKYMAKTVAYLSLRNDKYKPALLGGEGSRALVSILVILPQKISPNARNRNKDLAYYLSKSENDTQAQSKANNRKSQDQPAHNSAAVSHACCALANFATNNESQVNLMSLPHLLQYICNVYYVFPENTEIHRHVARCLANLTLYEENNEAMLSNEDKKSGSKDCFNVLPTLLLMGKKSKSAVQRHIVRALDNLSSNVPANTAQDGGLSSWKEIFADAFVYIQSILDDKEGENIDIDTIKRAKSIAARERFDSIDFSTLSKAVQDIQQEYGEDDVSTIPSTVTSTPTHEEEDEMEEVVQVVAEVVPEAAPEEAAEVTPEEPTEATTEESTETVTEDEPNATPEVLSEDTPDIVINEPEEALEEAPMQVASEEASETVTTEVLSELEPSEEEPKKVQKSPKNKKRSKRHK